MTEVRDALKLAGLSYAAWRGLVKTQRSNGWLRKAGRCTVRYGAGAAFHPEAPIGASHCRICGRVVLRGEGRWWA